jgi:hypothetical protein
VTQTFCRHNRFIQRCPICRETVPGFTPPREPAKPKRRGAVGDGAGAPTGRAGTAAGASARGGPSAASRSSATGSAGGRGSARRTTTVRVRHEERAQDDGYRHPLVPGIHSSHDARRLAREIGFASGRLLTLTAAPPSLYAEARACEDLEQATWMCFLAAYLSPLQGAQSFVGIRQALLCNWASGGVPELEDVPLGPRTSHDPARGSRTLAAYRRFAEHAGSQERAFAGEPEWTPQRRFERVFERLALPGFGRMGRYDLLITLGRLGLYELRADSLHLAARPGARPGAGAAAGAGAGGAGEDPTPLAAKRVFGIGDPLNIERRAAALAQALATPIEALDLALYNWSSPLAEAERVTLGFPADTNDAHALDRALAALEL